MIALEPDGQAWSGADGGVDFRIRPVGGAPTGPALWENSNYHLLVSLPAGPPTEGAEIRVGGLPLRTWREGDLLLGQLETGHTFGALRVDVLVGGAVVAEASVDVQPRHLDVDADFAHMKADLDRVSYSLAYAVWRRAHHRAFPDFTVPPGTPEWLAMLRTSWSRIARALREIADDPNTELRRIHEVRRAEHVGLLDMQSLRWLAQQPSAWASQATPFPVASLEVGGRFIAPERALAVRRRITVDTPANRALKRSLSQLELRLRGVLRSIEALPAKHFAAGDKEAYADQLRRVLRDSQHHTVHGFLRNVDAQAVASAKGVHAIRSDPRYRQVFRSLAVLQWGVVSDVAGSVAEMSLKDTWELYEYWVYLYVLDLFAEWGWDCVAQGALTTSQPGAPIVVDLVRGVQSRATFERTDPGTGEYSLANVTFHRQFPSRRANKGLGQGAMTVTRDVDILVEVESSGSVRRLVLDPKYRAELVDELVSCPPSAVNDMHVYRDAIGRWEMGAAGARHFVQALDAAVAVFPSHDEAAAASSIFYESLDDGIGALPLLPSDGTGPQLLPDYLAAFVT